ncbi:protein with putative role during mitosis, partial [Kappamyces sp. JEL0680]
GQSHLKPVLSMAIHPFHLRLASGSDDASIKIWDLETGAFEKTLKGHTRAVTALAFDRSGGHLLSSSADLSIKVWDCVNGWACVRTLHGHDNTISGLCALPSHLGFVSVSRDETIRVWDLETGSCKNTLAGHSDWIRCVAASSDGQWMATCGNDMTIVVWNTSTWTVRGELKGHEHVVETVAFAPLDSARFVDVFLGKQDRQESSWYLASGSRDKTVKIWCLQTMECVATLHGHDNWVKDIAFHGSGSHLFSTGDDKSLRIWSLSTCQLAWHCAAVHSKFVNRLLVHPTLPLVITASADNSVKAWRLQ